MHYDVDEVVSRLGYNPYEIPTVPIGAKCSRCNLVPFLWSKCPHFGNRKQHHLDSKYHHENQNKELLMFRNDVVFPIIQELSEEIRKNSRINLFLTIRHAKFQDLSMDLSNETKLLPEIKILGVPLFPLNTPVKFRLGIHEMCLHITEIIVHIWNLFSDLNLEVKAYFGSDTPPIYAYVKTMTELKFRLGSELENWQVCEMYPDEKIQTKKGDTRQTGFHQINLFNTNPISLKQGEE
tara:strand:+ start:181 stop:891 length:711 start_codon:yes stop_codon:yes gene_type:complete